MRTGTEGACISQTTTSLTAQMDYNLQDEVPTQQPPTLTKFKTNETTKYYQK